MKCRTGFVSNSSTASFIIKLNPDMMDDTDDLDKQLLTPEQMDFLKEIGFCRTWSPSPFHIEFGGKWKYIPEPDAITGVYPNRYLGYHINCNHRDVLSLLIAHEIPFKAAVHYGQYLYHWEPGDKDILVIRNFGIDYDFHPKRIIDDLKEPEDDLDTEWEFHGAFKRICVEYFMEGYNEKESLMIMGVK